MTTHASPRDMTFEEFLRSPSHHAHECECDECNALPRCSACHAKIADADDVVKDEDGRTYCDWHLPEGVSAVVATPGRIAYEQDVATQPTYPCGDARKAWSDLSDMTRAAWEKDPTPRDKPGHLRPHDPASCRRCWRLAEGKP